MVDHGWSLILWWMERWIKGACQGDPYSHIFCSMGNCKELLGVSQRSNSYAHVDKFGHLRTTKCDYTINVGAFTHSAASNQKHGCEPLQETHQSQESQFHGSGVFCGRWLTLRWVKPINSCKCCWAHPADWSNLVAARKIQKQRTGKILVLWCWPCQFYSKQLHCKILPKPFCKQTCECPSFVVVLFYVCFMSSCVYGESETHQTPSGCYPLGFEGSAQAIHVISCLRSKYGPDLPGLELEPGRPESTLMIKMSWVKCNNTSWKYAIYLRQPFPNHGQKQFRIRLYPTSTEFPHVLAFLPLYSSMNQCSKVLCWIPSLLTCRNMAGKSPSSCWKMIIKQTLR